jgi:tetratricopeptide (TPR) repeat protein
MLVSVLISLLVVVGVIVVYLFLLAPRLNPLKRADFFLSQNLVDQAMLEYEKILEYNPANPVAHYRLALIFLDRGQLEEGVRHLEEVIRTNKYGSELDKAAVERRLAEAYISQEKILEAFKLLFEILKQHPGDTKALYHIAFILLGQEYFDMAQRYFDRLVRLEERNFEILFGAGIASYQGQKTADAVDCFKEALSIDPHSDIANLAMAFAQQRKHDYKAALNYARMIIDTSKDQNALFIARRFFGILATQAGRPAEGVKVLEELLNFARKMGSTDEEKVVLYDLGFAALNAEMTEIAYGYWDQLYQEDREFRDIQSLTTMLRKEMDFKSGPADVEGSVTEYTDEWLRDAFSPDFLWHICGLKSERKIDLGPVLAAASAESTREDTPDKRKALSSVADEKVDAFIGLDVENFRIIANRVATKLGYRVDEILQTYREPDGVDFLAYSQPSKDKTLIWVRRWKDIRVGEIPFRNLAQAVNDMKARQGIFICTTELTEAGEDAVRNLSKVKVILPAELGNLLTDLV